MYKRGKKDDYRKRIEEIIGEAKNVRERALLTATISIIITPTLVMTPPLLWIAALMTAMTLSSSANSNNIDNYNTNISNDTTSVMDCSINDSNDVVASSDINDSSSGINDNAKNDELDMNNIRVQRWNPVSTRVEGICKYLEANKINLNYLITKLL